MRVTILRAVLLTLAVSLSLPAAAGATIVPQKGMKGVRLGMTVEQVRDELGAPSRSAVVRHEIIGKVRELRYGLTVMTFGGTNDNAELNAISTTSTTERLANGIGVGSTRAAVARKVKGVRCEVVSGFDHCSIGAFRAGRTVTDFHISKKGRVKRIVVGIVID